MLDLIKDHIFTYAHKYSIPYFKNSTPIWSCRGVLRDQIMPILKHQFGDFEPNIIKMMNTCIEMSQLNTTYIIQPYLNSVIKFKHGIKIKYNPDLIIGIVWDKILLDLFHSNGYRMISTKSKIGFFNWLKIFKIHG